MNLKKLTSLTLTELNSHFSVSKIIYNFKYNKKERFLYIFLTAVLLITFISLIPLYFIFLKSLLYGFMQLNMTKMFLYYIITGCGTFGIFLSFLVLIGEFFFNKDLRLLITLPLKPSEVILSKFFVILFDQIILNLIVLLPAFIYFGLKTDVSFLYWVFSFICSLTAGIFPVFIISVFILPVSRFFKFAEKKDAYILFSSIVFVVLIFIFQFSFMQSASSFSSQEDMVKILSDTNSFMNRFSNVYPISFIMTEMLINTPINSVLWFIAYIVLNFFMIFLTAFLGEKFYYNTYMELQESGNKKAKKISSVDYKENKNTIKILILREWKYFIRTPSFSFNGFGNILAFPLMVVLFYVFSGKIIDKDMQMILDFIDNFRFYTIPLGIAFSVLSGGLNALAFSALSREGKNINELKILPFKPIEIYHSKVIFMNIFGFLGVLLSDFALFIVLKSNIFEIIAIVIIGSLNVFFINSIEFFIDIKRPYLNWDNPQKAMKQNINSLFSIPISFGYTFLIGYLIYILNSHINQYVFSLFFLLISIAGIYFMKKINIRSVEKLFKNDIII